MQDLKLSKIKLLDCLRSCTMSLRKSMIKMINMILPISDTSELTFYMNEMLHRILDLDY